MDQTMLDDLRAELEADRALQVSFLEEHGADPYDEAVRDLQIGNDGFADSAQATEERSALLGKIEVARHRVQQIDAALERMEDGSYGRCISCGEQIAPARLEVRPLSVTCVACAEKSS